MTMPRYTLRLTLLTIAILAGMVVENGRGGDHASKTCHACFEASALS